MCPYAATCLYLAIGNKTTNSDSISDSLANEISLNYQMHARSGRFSVRNISARNESPGYEVKLLVDHLWMCEMARHLWQDH